MGEDWQGRAPDRARRRRGDLREHLDARPGVRVHVRVRVRVCACARVVFVLRRGTRGAFCPFGFTRTSLQQSLGSTMTALQRWRRVRRDKEGPGCHGAKC